MKEWFPMIGTQTIIMTTFIWKWSWTSLSLAPNCVFYYHLHPDHWTRLQKYTYSFFLYLIPVWLYWAPSNSKLQCFSCSLSNYFSSFCSSRYFRLSLFLLLFLFYLILELDLLYILTKSVFYKLSLKYQFWPTRSFRCRHLEPRFR